MALVPYSFCNAADRRAFKRRADLVNFFNSDLFAVELVRMRFFEVVEGMSNNQSEKSVRL